MKKTGKGSTAGRRERRAFSAEFKAEAVRLVVERRAHGVSVAQVGRELDIRSEQLRAWALAESGARGGGTAVAGETMDQEVRRLRRENAVLRQEQAFAKKVAVYFAEGVALRYAVITRHRREFKLRCAGESFRAIPSCPADRYRGGCAGFVCRQGAPAHEGS